MVNDSEQAGGGAGQGGITGRLLAIMVAFGPPVAVSGWLWPKIRENLALSLLVLIGYWALVAVVRLLSRVGRAVSDLWIPRAAAAVDRRLSAVVKSYRSRYLNRLLFHVRDIELLGMATQGEFSLELRHVYVDVSLAPSPLQTTTHEPFVGTEPLAGERRTLDSFLDSRRARVFAVIGGPGSGKTTLLRRTAMALGEGRRGKRSLPLVLYLRDHVQEIVLNPSVTIAELLATVAWLKGTVTPDWFERCLERGRCVVMLDGLDEVAVEEQRQLTSMWVRDQVARYPANHFVLTSRPHGYHSNPVTGADVLQVRRFTSDQIVKFVHGWYYAIECRFRNETGERTREIAKDHADDLLRRMRLQPALYDLAANPMLLTMIANVHKYRGALPGSRAALYGEMCALLLHRRQEAKNLPAGSGLKAEQRAKVVGELALAMMSQEVRDVTLAAANEIVGPSLARIPRVATSDSFLDELTKSGLFVEREVGKFAFAHQTLQEYLAAVEIRDHPETNVLPTVVDNAWWRETILLWAANADASPVVAACLASGSVDALALAFDCADEAREVDADLLRQLNELLYSDPATSDATARSERRRLIAAVRASRSLRHTVPLSEGAIACANLFPRSLYQLYAGWSGDPAADDRTLKQATRVPDDDGVEATGVSAVDADKIVTWVNGLFDDGTVYRLPTRREIADPMTGVVLDLTRHSVWYKNPDPPAVPADDDERTAASIDQKSYTGPRLYVPRGVLHPCVASADQLEDSIRRDLRTLAGMIPFVLGLSLERNPTRARSLDFQTALRRLEQIDNSAVPGLIPEPIHVDRALARSRGGDLAYNPDLLAATERIRQLARDLAATTAFPVKADPVRELRQTLRKATPLAEALGQALDLILTHSLQADDITSLVHELQDAGRSGEIAGLPLSDWAARRISTHELELTVLALSLLLSLWEPHRAKNRSGTAWVQFEQFPVELFPLSAEVRPTIPDEAESILHEVRSLVVGATWLGSTFEGADHSRDEISWRILARRIAVVSAATVGSVVRRPSGMDSGGAAIRMGLLAAACLADKFTDGSIASKLRGVHSSLTCLEIRRTRKSSASEVLLLMRA